MMWHMYVDLAYSWDSVTWHVISLLVQKHSHRWLNSFRAAFKNSNFHTFTDFLGLNNKLDIKECRQLTIIYTCYDWSCQFKPGSSAQVQRRDRDRVQRNEAPSAESPHITPLRSFLFLSSDPRLFPQGLSKWIKSNLICFGEHRLNTNISVRND